MVHHPTQLCYITCGRSNNLKSGAVLAPVSSVKFFIKAWQLIVWRERRLRDKNFIRARSRF